MTKTYNNDRQALPTPYPTRIFVLSLWGRVLVIISFMLGVGAAACFLTPTVQNLVVIVVSSSMSRSNIRSIFKSIRCKFRSHFQGDIDKIMLFLPPFHTTRYLRSTIIICHNRQINNPICELPCMICVMK